MSKNHRIRNTLSSAAKKRILSPNSVSPIYQKIRKKSQSRHRKVHIYGKASEAGLCCTGRANLAACMRNTSKIKRFRFYGKKRVLSECKACGEMFCLTAPENLVIPGSNPQRHFRKNGPSCWLLIHGYSSWTDFWERLLSALKWYAKTSKLKIILLYCKRLLL